MVSDCSHSMTKSRSNPSAVLCIDLILQRRYTQRREFNFSFSGFYPNGTQRVHKPDIAEVQSIQHREWSPSKCQAYKLVQSDIQSDLRVTLIQM